MRRRAGHTGVTSDDEGFGGHRTRGDGARIEPNFGAPDHSAALDEFDVLMGDTDSASAPTSRRSGERRRAVPAGGDEFDALMSMPNPRRRASDAAGRHVEPATDARVGRAPKNARQRAPARRSAAAPVRPWRVQLDKRWLWLPLVMLVVAAVYFGYEPLQKLLERPFKSVVVEGEFHFVSKARATELIGDEIDNNFLQLDLMRLKRSLSADPWVDEVSLQRRWPDTLVVKIAEQKPIARWDDGFLNQRGQIVKVAEADRLQGLPWLQGSETDAVEILQQYQDLSQLLRSRGLDVVVLRCDNKKSWRLTLKNEVEIAIGRTKVMEKMRRFVTVYDTHLNRVWTDVAAIDVRYSNGLAVRWVEGSESAKTYLRATTAAVSNGSPVQP